MSSSYSKPKKKESFGTLAGAVSTQHTSVTQRAWSFSTCGGWCLVRTTIHRHRKHLNLSLPSPEQFSQNKPNSCMILVHFAFKAIYIYIYSVTSEALNWGFEHSFALFFQLFLYELQRSELRPYIFPASAIFPGWDPSELMFKLPATHFYYCGPSQTPHKLL